VSGSAGSEVTIPIGWLPGVPDNWTIGAKGEASGSVGSAEASGGGYAYRDRADSRYHAGAFAGVGLGLGGAVLGDLSIGPGAKK
jgi:type VI secretion system secreted protein VgrG